LCGDSHAQKCGNPPHVEDVWCQSHTDAGPKLDNRVKHGAEGRGPPRPAKEKKVAEMP